MVEQSCLSGAEEASDHRGGHAFVEIERSHPGFFNPVVRLGDKAPNAPATRACGIERVEAPEELGRGRRRGGIAWSEMAIEVVVRCCPGYQESKRTHYGGFAEETRYRVAASRSGEGGSGGGRCSWINLVEGFKREE